MHAPVIYWYRQDLRVDDLPGLRAAAASGQPVLPCYILDDITAGALSPGGASRWWLHHSLTALAADLTQLGLPLILLRGESEAELASLATATGATAIFCSRRYEPAEQELEKRLHGSLQSAGIVFKRYPGALLFEPGDIHNQSNLPFKVFTPFWKHCLRQGPATAPSPKPDHLIPWEDSKPTSIPQSLSLPELNLRPVAPDWAANWPALWSPGADGARASLQRFLDGPIADYDEGRNHPSRAATSRLSPHLHFGEISPRQVRYAIHSYQQQDSADQGQCAKFLSELGWREFSYHLLHHFPTMVEQPFRAEFKHFPWQDNKALLTAWQKGMTGYPLVDAGMRELWQTGYMHNRVRMIAASFLTKHLLIHWRAGESWFRDTLLDADLASNTCGWQWVAGSGADAAPYFRIFNPTLQGTRFDKEGGYIRRWVPELASLPDKFIHQPAAAPAEVLAAANVELGITYPQPVVDHTIARETALAAYAEVRAAR